MQAKDTERIGESFKWLIGISVVVIILLIGYVAVKPATIPEGYLSPEEITSAINEKVSTALTESDAKIQSKDTEIESKDVEIESLREIILTLNKTSNGESGQQVTPLGGYLIGDLYLGTLFNNLVDFKGEYSDRELSKLFDGKVDFKSNEYDAEEVLTLGNMKILTNENDFEGVDYLTIEEEGISYTLAFEDDLNTSEINDEDTLEFNFLGESYELSKWDNDEITLTKGTEYIFKPLEGIDQVTIDDKNVKVISISDESVFIEVDGTGRSIKESQTRTINSLEIQVKSCFESSNYAAAVLKIGEEVEKEITNTNEYNEDSIWSWSITNNSIGLVLNREFEEIGEDEDYPAIAKERTICLPNDYICIRYNGLGYVDREDYSFDLYGNDEYVRISGSFQKGTKDYNKIYVNESGIYDKDKGHYVLIDNFDIELGDTDYTLDVDSNEIVIGDFEVSFELNETNIGSHDYKWMTDEGIIVENTDDALDNNEFEISVPIEKVSGSISLITTEVQPSA